MSSHLLNVLEGESPSNFGFRLVPRKRISQQGTNVQVRRVPQQFIETTLPWEHFVKGKRLAFFGSQEGRWGTVTGVESKHGRHPTRCILWSPDDDPGATTKVRYLPTKKFLIPG